jgi:Beta propeller domain
MNTIKRFSSSQWRLAGKPGAARVSAGTLLALTGLVLAACAGSPASGHDARAPSAANVALVRFTSCGDALRNLQAAATSALASGGSGAGTAGPTTASGSAGSGSGLHVGSAPPSAAGAVAGNGAVGANNAAAPGSYSGTNTATPGVDEPDLVKTDGRRIVTISGGVLRVVDAQTRELTGAVDLSSVGQYAGLAPASLLLAGDHALVLFSQNFVAASGGLPTPGATGSGTSGPFEPVTPQGSASSGTATPIAGPLLVLVDLSTPTPEIISEYTIDGSLIDARQVGSVARVVIQSGPRLYLPLRSETGQPAAAGSAAAITQAGISQWLPRYSVTTGTMTRTGQVNCASVSHPAAASYTGSSMLTVLTFDLAEPSLGDGEPVTVVADGDTVYSDGTSLYIASREWAAQPEPGTAGGTVPGGRTDIMPIAPPGYTAIYKFDISGPGLPVYEASGSVPGWLLGSSGTAQYSLSAWHGALRVATTTSATFTAGTAQESSSAVYVLEQSGDQLVVIGKAGGLGAGEQIYAVRFVGPAGYVVTFRQTDPLYTLDLSDPAQPRVVGQLPLSGYSSYMYPLDATHLIGVGQDANADGQTTGTQISLFDVSDLGTPVRLATYDLQLGHSEAEFDPHAFLYWPATRLLVIPVQLSSGVAPQPASPPSDLVPGNAAESGSPQSGSAQSGSAQSGPAQASPAYFPISEAIVLHVGNDGFTEVGAITHPVTASDPAGGQISRSLVVGSALWTLSDAGLMANDSTTLAPLAWIPFTSAAQ